MRALLLLAALLLALPATAAAAPPANDRPQTAAEFTPFTAGNLPEGQLAEERQAVIDLSEATADRGVPRCLGKKSFARMVWFVVPASAAPRTVRVEASSPSGGTSEVPDLALFVGTAAGPQGGHPQACDGPAAGARSTSAAAVQARIPANRTVLVQIGRRAGQFERRVIASLRVTDAGAPDLFGTPTPPALPAPAGDVAGRAPRLPLDVRRRVGLAGATLTDEDPAQPACPADATVWRRTKVRRTGRHVLVARGRGAGSLTAFVGRRPSADGARACVNRARSAGPMTLAVDLKRGDTLWTRVGADQTAARAAVVLAVRAPERPRRRRS